ncbi:hypothetical protein HYX70_01435 [Candidatus Saccharibacteria bacterium]|nr:hypothetical protein [Candidatus Saccharibacteria bacterium]
MNIYLDIDGVLLANDRFAAHGADEFLLYVLQNYPDTTYWLSTHCHGNENRTIEAIGSFLKPETMELVKTIKPTNWGLAKTEAIDFNQPFLWFDDDLYKEEQQALEQHDCMPNFVEVDLRKDENALQKLIKNFSKPVQPKV